MGKTFAMLCEDLRLNPWNSQSAHEVGHHTHICSLGSPVVRWETETAESLKALRQAGLVYKKQAGKPTNQPTKQKIKLTQKNQTQSKWNKKQNPQLFKKY